MRNYPYTIDDDENIVRGICSPYHVKNGKLKRNAFDAPFDSDEVSVIRHDWVGMQYCRKKSKELEDVSSANEKKYKGMAVLKASTITSSGADLVDSRRVFEGHADIRHKIIRQRGVPVPAEQVKILQDRSKYLLENCSYHEDPDCDLIRPAWEGTPFGLSVGVYYYRKDRDDSLFIHTRLEFF